MTADRTPPLRDQIAEALYRWTTQQAAGGPARLLTRDETVLWENSLARADAVLPVVEAALARARASCCEDGDRTYAEMERHLTQRAEQAERERDTAREALDAAAIVIASLRDQRDEQRQRAENAEMEGRNILRRLDIADRLAAALEAERDKARAAVADEQRRADERSTELLEERDEALDALADAEKRAEQAERQRDQALNAIADERRGRLAVEAAVRRALAVLDQRIGLILGEVGPELRRALTIEQPKETP